MYKMSDDEYVTAERFLRQRFGDQTMTFLDTGEYRMEFGFGDSVYLRRARVLEELEAEGFSTKLGMRSKLGQRLYGVWMLDNWYEAGVCVRPLFVSDADANRWQTYTDQFQDESEAEWWEYGHFPDEGPPNLDR